jgi:pimeloyl-ACP methyl ester carboxylesterase
MRDTPLLLGRTESLVGILTEPPKTERGAELPAVIILNAGIVHRIGPNRLYVRMARDLAGLGFSVLRFDFSGVGDSRPRRDHLPFHNSAVLETQEAMNYLQATRGIEQFILTGICSGAVVSFRTAGCDRRVRGAVLINARGHLHDSMDGELSSHIRSRALAHHYWRLALFSSFGAKNVLRALRGAVDHRSIIPVMLGVPLRKLFTRQWSLSAAANRGEELRLLAERDVRLLHVYSEGDQGLDYLRVVLGNRLHELSRHGLLETEIVHGANHTFTLRWSQEYLLKLVRDWVWETAQDLLAERIPSES